jgi:predicted acylesterase/phospholipase RssA
MENVQSRVVAALVVPALRKWNSAKLRAGLQDMFPGDMRFGDLQEISGLRVHVLVCCMRSTTTRMFSTDRHGHLSLIDVIQSSCSIPFVFEPVVIGERSYVDGGALSGLWHHRIRPAQPALYVVSPAGTSGWNLNVYEQLYNAMCDSRRRQRDIGPMAACVHLPRRSAVMLSASRRRIEDLFYQGAAFAALELTLHRSSVPAARMRCCSVSAKLALLVLPATREHEHACDQYREHGVRIVHAAPSATTKPTCHCGARDIMWYIGGRPM